MLSLVVVLVVAVLVAVLDVARAVAVGLVVVAVVLVAVLVLSVVLYRERDGSTIYVNKKSNSIVSGKGNRKTRARTLCFLSEAVSGRRRYQDDQG